MGHLTCLAVTIEDAVETVRKAKASLREWKKYLVYTNAKY
jgi:hypothetical protein